MSARVRDLLMGRLGDLRYEPIAKRIRAELGDRTVVDSTRAMLVWEPRRIVPSYAVPASDIAATVEPAAARDPGEWTPVRLGELPVLDPSIPFAVHEAPGEPVEVRDDGHAVEGFRPTDPALEGYVILDFAGFDAWYEEDEPNVGHPRDPFHRIDIVHSSRHVRIEHDGELLAESHAPYLLFETSLPVRFYLPPEDVATERLRPSDKQSTCAYKGHASYWSLDGAPDVAWTYVSPLREAAEVTGRIAFFDERLDVMLDGERRERPITPWSRG